MVHMTKAWLITGASSGFGRGMTEALLARGDRVVATVRRPEVLDDLKAAYGDGLHVEVLDVTDLEAVRRVVDAAFAALGCIDVVVSNAGYAVFGAAEEADDAAMRHVIDTNLVGSIALIRACLPHLRRQGGGRVLQVSSEGGRITYPAFSLYHATKWGIEGFVEAMAKETAPYGIGFTLVEPGPTAGTDFLKGLVRTEPMAEYEAGPAGEVRRAVQDGGGFEIRGDAGRTVEAMIACADAPAVPLRLTLGSTAYAAIRATLSEQLQALDAQKDIAFSADKAA